MPMIQDCKATSKKSKKDLEKESKRVMRSTRKLLRLMKEVCNRHSDEPGEPYGAKA
jgi:hypothetical protein